MLFRSGPAPTYENFTLSPFERALLSLGTDEVTIKPVDVLAADTLNNYIKDAKQAIASGTFEVAVAAQGETSESANTPTEPKTPPPEPAGKKRRLRKKSAPVVQTVTPPPATSTPSESDSVESNNDAVSEEVVVAEPEESDERHRPTQIGRAHV